MAALFQWLSRMLAFAALLWCLWGSAQIWTTPVIFQGVEMGETAAGVASSKQITASRAFSEISGCGMIPLLIPVCITMLAAWAAVIARTRVLMASTLALLVFWVLTGFSIGGAYMPAVLALFGASITGIASARYRKTP